MPGLAHGQQDEPLLRGDVSVVTAVETRPLRLRNIHNVATLLRHHNTTGEDNVNTREGLRSQKSCPPFCFYVDGIYHIR